MSEAILWHALAGFAGGGAFIGLCSAVAMRGNPVLAGVLTGMPSTALISLLVLALSVSPGAASEAATAAPAALGLNCVFFGLFGRFGRVGLVVGLAGGLMLWLVLATAWWTAAPRDLVSSLAMLAVGGAAGLFMVRGLSGGSVGPRPLLGGLAMTARAVFGGLMVAATVLVSYWGGSFAGGLAAAFPAAAVATLAIVGWTSGLATANAMLRHIILANVLTIAPYVLVVRSAYGTIGVWAGTLLGLAVSTVAAWGLYTVSHRCQRKAS